MNTALADFTSRWSAGDDRQWPDAMDRRGRFIEGWSHLIDAPPGSLTRAESVTALLYTLMRGIPEKRLAGRSADRRRLISQPAFPAGRTGLADWLHVEDCAADGPAGLCHQ